MKSYCKNLVIDRDLVVRAYEGWRSGCSGHKNAYRVTDEYGSADALIDEILWQLTMRTLEFRPIHRYQRVEPTNGKRRVIGVESVKQQVCDYLAIIALQSLLDAKIGFYQVASIPGKGQRLVRGALRRWAHEGGYHVKADVKQCYPSISQDVVMRVLRKYVRSDDVLYLCETLLDTYDNGLEIGSFFALKMASLILSFGYHHVEGLGKVRRGKWVPLVAHQIWHMDDLMLMGRSKRDLRMAIRSLERFLMREFGLTLKPWKIARTNDVEPLDMGGWIVRDGRVTLRAGLFLRARKAFARFAKKPSLALARRCCSYWGWLIHSDSDGVMTRNKIRETMRRARRKVSRHDMEVRRCIESEALTGSTAC